MKKNIQVKIHIKMIDLKCVNNVHLFISVITTINSY